MIINHNIAAIIANGHLKTTNNALGASLERLSSGYKINKAADDAAGMAISQKMKAQIRGLNQASDNSANGISVIQTAEGALSETEAMLQRARELSVQSVNGTNTAQDRKAIQMEVDELLEEIDRISTDTEFNTKTLLDGNLDRVSYTDTVGVSIIAASDEVDSKVYGFEITATAVKASVTGGAITLTGTDVIGEKGDIVINGEKVEVEANDTIESLKAKIGEVCNRADIDMSITGGKFAFSTKKAGVDQSVVISCENTTIAAKLGITNVDTTKDTGAGIVKGADAVVKLESGFTGTTAILTDGNKVTFKDSNGFEMKIDIDLTIATGGTAKKVKAVVIDAGPLVLQVGSNEGQTVSLSIPEVSCRTLDLENVNVQTEDSASASITRFDNAINHVSAVRGKLGAYQNRLDHAIASLDETSANLDEALSRIEDTDMAEEMANYTQLNVLSQAGTSMLAQANQQPQNILSLLQ